MVTGYTGVGPGSNFFAKQNPNVNISHRNELGYAVITDGYGNPNIVATESNIYNTGCFYTRNDILSGNNVYTNQGTLASPSWVLIGSGGGGGVESVTDDGNMVVTVDNTDPLNPVIDFNGVFVDGVTITGNGQFGNPLVSVSSGTIVIGNPVSGGDANDILFVDGSGNLGQNDAFYYDQVGFQTQIQNNSSTFYQDGTTGTTTISSYGITQLSVSDDTGLQEFGDVGFDWYGDLLKIDGPNRQISFQDAGEMYLNIDNANRLYQFGDLLPVGNGTYFSIDDNAESITNVSNGTFIVQNRANSEYLSIDNVNDLFGLGDLSGAVNNTKLVIDDASSVLNFTAHNGLQLTDPNTLGQWFKVQPHSGFVQFGDLTSVGNSTAAYLNDGNQSIVLSAGNSTKGEFVYEDTLGNAFIQAKNASGNWNVGIGDLNYPSSGFNGTALTLNDGVQSASLTANNQFTYQDVNGNYYLVAAQSSGFYGIGDINGNYFNTSFQINDGTQQYIFNQPNFTIFGLDYVFPNSYADPGVVFLSNDGSGNLSWINSPTTVSMGDPIGGGHTHDVFFVGGSALAPTIDQSDDFAYDPSGTFSLGFAGHSYMQMLTSTGGVTTQIGDITGAYQHTILTVNDPDENITLQAGGTGVTGTGVIMQDTSSNPYFSLLPLGSGEVQIQMGALASGNGTIFALDDSTQTYTFNEPNFDIAGADYVFPSSYPATPSVMNQDGAGNITWGGAGVVASSYIVNQSSTATVTSYSVPAGADHSYNIGGYIDVVSISAASSVILTVTWSDETTTRSAILATGATAVAVPVPVTQIRAKAGTTITVTATFVTSAGLVTYDAGGSIQFIY